MSDELPRLQASRRAYKSHITRLCNKIDDALDADVDDYTITALRTNIDQLNGKKTKIAELDEKIAALITDPDELTDTMIDAGELEDSITDKIAKVLRFIELNTQAERPQPNPVSELNPISQSSAAYASTLHLLSSHDQPITVSTQPLESSNDQTTYTGTSHAISSMISVSSMARLSTATTAPLFSTPPLWPVASASNHTMNFYSETLPPISSSSLASHSSASQTIHAIPDLTDHTHASSSQSLNSRLPKLTLPVFSGDPLHWQTFWDSFSAAVHMNPALGCIQKFNYLKAQLQGDAARAIAGLPLTERNYQHSIELLEERFGQTHKLINAHMQALLDMPNPTSNLTSLRLFYDTIATHTRALESLGKSKESYGDLLVSVILKKLPVEVRKNLAREQDSIEWTFDDLTKTILKEIRVLEAGYQVTDSHNTPRTTASFYVGHKSNPGTQATKKSPSCAFCKAGPHPSHSCTTVTEYSARIDLVRRENLCFNCLGHHKVS